MNRYTFCLIAGAISLLPLATHAQDFASSASIYEDGVQAYFRGCPAEAEGLFSTLMSLDPLDPRAFYFRALSLSQQGRDDEARTDMQVGAQLEASMPNRFDIGKTLLRVQGPTRLTLERYRSEARQLAAANPRLGALRSPDTAVLRQLPVVPHDKFGRSGAPQSFTAPAPVDKPIRRAPTSPIPPVLNLNPAPTKTATPFQEATPAGPTPKTQPKSPPTKAATPATPPPAKSPVPPAPKSAEPESTSTDENPF